MLSFTSTGGAEAAINATPYGQIIASASASLAVVATLVQNHLIRQQQKEGATLCADRTEQLMEANRAAYMEDPARTQRDRQTAIGHFDALGLGLMECCGQSSLATAGQRCIAERLNGSPARWLDGTTYQWASWYLKPILDDNPPGGGVATGIEPIDNAVSSAAAAIGVSPWMAVGLIALGLGILYWKVT